MRRLSGVCSALFCTAALLPACRSGSAAATAPEHIRGTIQSVDDQSLTLTTSTGWLRVQLAPSTAVATVAQSDRARLTDGSFLGITSVTEPDGSQRAVEVHVFPESMRGTGEGSRGWDWPGVTGGGKMTNGTVNLQVQGVQNGIMTVTYKGQESKIALTPETKIVAYTGGDESELDQWLEHVFSFCTDNDCV